MPRSTATVSVLFLVAAAGLFASGRPEAPVAAAPPLTIQVQVQAGHEERTDKGLVDLFNSTHPGIKAELVTVPRAGMEDKNLVMLQSGASNPTVIQENTLWPKTYAAHGWVVPLDPYLEDPKLKPADLELADFPPGILSAVQYQGKTYGLIQDLSAYLLYYRSDLIAKPPQTWEELEQVARKFTRSLNPSSPTRYGTAWQAQKGSLNPKEWSNIFWSMGGQWLIKSGDDYHYKPDVASEAGIKSLEYGVRFLKDKLVPSDSINHTYADTNTAFQQGLVPMVLQRNAAYTTFKNPSKSPKIYDKFAVTEVPGERQIDGKIYRAPYVQAHSYMVNAGSVHVEQGAVFVMWLMSRSTQKEYAMGATGQAGNTASLPVMNDPEVLKARPEYAFFESTFAIGRTYPTIERWAELHDIVDQALASAMTLEQTPRQALEQAQSQMAAVLRQMGRLAQ